MKKGLYTLLLLLAAVIMLASCSKDDDNPNAGSGRVEQALIMYWPWTGNATSDYGSLTDAFRQNLTDLKEGIKNDGGIYSRQKVMVFFADSPTTAALYELIYNNGQVEEKTVKSYSSLNYANSATITEVLNDVKNYTNSEKYAMVFGGHGSGWTQKDSWLDYPNNVRGRDGNVVVSSGVWNAPHFTMSRFMGSIVDKDYAVDITDIEKGIADAGLHLQFLLLDDCYMANVENAYTLRKVTDHLVASTSEVMKYGMPYHKMYKYMRGNTPNYTGMVDAFYSFYKTFTYPWGALSVIDCTKTDNLAKAMKDLNSKYSVSATNLANVQKLDGFDKGAGYEGKNIFYDINSYVKQMNPSASNLATFQAALKSVIVANKYTDEIFTNIYGTEYHIPMNNNNSGMTISDPTTHAAALRGLHSTEWWSATH